MGSHDLHFLSWLAAGPQLSSKQSITRQQATASLPTEQASRSSVSCVRIRIVVAEARGAAFRLAHEAFALVEAHGLDAHPGRLRYLADRQSAFAGFRLHENKLTSRTIVRSQAVL